VSYDAEFDLRIVGSQQNVIFVSGNKSLTYFTPPLGADGNILQVGVGRAQTPCGCNGLIVVRVDTLVVAGLPDRDKAST